MNRVAVIGGGAAGFFAAIHVKENFPDANVVLMEKTSKVLSKVKISGGGRCNVTNATSSISELAKAYPRGGKQMKKLFPRFNTVHTKAFFESRNVPLVAEADGRVFPKANKSQAIIDLFFAEIERLGVELRLNTHIKEIKQQNSVLALNFDDNWESYDKVVVATGGSPKLKGFEWMKELGHHIISPLPSLFTFNMPQEPIIELMGVVAEHTTVKIQGSKMETQGPLLITHWGMSGPAILKLSAFSAVELNELNYDFSVLVNWLSIKEHHVLRELLEDHAAQFSNHTIGKSKPVELPNRLYLFLLRKAGLSTDKPWGEMGKKNINKLISIFLSDAYSVTGKTTYKEEFVTCGGIDLQSVNMKTMESKVCRNLYFAGEILNIDAITGGYNFQAAWTTAFVAAQLE